MGSRNGETIEIVDEPVWLEDDENIARSLGIVTVQYQAVKVGVRDAPAH